MVKTKRLIVRLSEAEYRALKRSARLTGRSMSDLVREAVKEAAEQDVLSEADETLDELWRALFEEEIEPGEELLPPFELGIGEVRRADVYEDLDGDDRA